MASNEGAELLRQVRQLQEYPIILAKRIGTTKYQGVTRFATRYNSTIFINPLYVQATELRNWINENKQMLIEYTMKSSAESASSLNLVAVDDEILSVSAITTQSSTISLYLKVINLLCSPSVHPLWSHTSIGQRCQIFKNPWIQHVGNKKGNINTLKKEASKLNKDVAECIGRGQLIKEN